MNYREKIQKMLDNADLPTTASSFSRKMFAYGFIFGVIAVAFAIFYNQEYLLSSIIGLGTFICFQIIVYAWLIIKANERIAKIEDVLPDFLALMSSNIRSGLTPDRAFLLSARKEFGPLANEIDMAAKETIAGKPFTEAFMSMTLRIQSETFAKTVRLIVEGVRSGGNLSELLDNTALDIRRFKSIRKEVSATVLVYQLFVFAAAGFGGPALYAVALFLIEMVAGLKEKIHIDPAVAAQMPLVQGTSTISIETVFLFALASMAITSFFGSLTAGVISKGKESEGIMFIPVLLFASYAVFFVTGVLLKAVLGTII
ncbi:MAG: type II secretion system F family protein [Candidatus ainarchaeum sp.]|nr:type II secretion system F family protein [Candidatus ainarchaeum sp.]